MWPKQKEQELDQEKSLCLKKDREKPDREIKGYL
jgi:hypothetical protein